MMDAANDPDVEQVVIMSSAQVGKALDIETPIPTLTGWKKMADLIVGDKVFDESGRPCSVTFATPTMHGRTCYRVKFSDGAELVADADHQWNVHNDIGGNSLFRIETKTTSELVKDYKVRNRNRYAIPVTKPIECDRARLPIDPYMLGVWLGDGHSYSTGISVGWKDRDEMVRLIKSCGYACKVQTEGNNWTIRVDPFRRHDGELCFGLSKDLRAAGLIGKGRGTKRIPGEYLRASVNQRMALLQGLMDTDGSINKRGRCEFVTTSQNLADGFRELIASLGFKAVMATKIPTTTYKGEKVLGAKAYRFTFISYQDMPVFRIRRKLERQPRREWRRTTETQRRRIISIVKVESVPVRCIQVDSPSRLYLAGRDFIPTHNTEILLNTIGYHIDYDPCPILVVQPDIAMAETFSKDRIAPMLRDTPAIAGKVADPKSRDSNNRILHKAFPGGRLTMVGANAPSGLAGRPIRVVLFDEVDRMPHSAGTEGDPIGLAIKRTTTFWNRKIIMVSTPTVKGLSRIEAAWEETDKRRFQIPCPYCSHEHALAWGNVKWKDGDGSTARMICPECSGEFTNAQKNAAVRNGRWVATEPFKGKAGFHLNELYSPWKSISEVVADFLESKSNPTRLQVWVNTSLGETWEEAAEQVTEHELMERMEPYAAPVPARGLFLTMGADVQPDRIEAEVVAWGAGEESWSIDHVILHGDPDIPEGERGSPWDAFTDLVRKSWRHESGLEISVSYTFIDSGGANTQAVYDYVKKHKGDRVFAIKGRGGEGVPIVGAPNRKQSGRMKRKVDLYIVGVDNAKAVVMKRLKIESPGPGYCHFPQGREADYFRQLTSEKVVTKFVHGFPRREWKKENGRRNEALDMRVYAFAALVMASPQFDKLAVKMRKKREEMGEKLPEPEKKEDKTTLDKPTVEEHVETKPRKARKKRSFVGNW